jgi:hypothetical protein
MEKSSPSKYEFINIKRLNVNLKPKVSLFGVVHQLHLQEPCRSRRKLSISLTFELKLARRHEVRDHEARYNIESF